MNSIHFEPYWDEAGSSGFRRVATRQSSDPIEVGTPALLLT